MEPLEVLFDDLPGTSAGPDELVRLYGGAIAFEAPVLYSNFVESLDGVVALEERESSGSVISEHNEGDRFIMGLLRACADAVLVGAGTFRATPGHRWTASGVFPGLADAFAELRRQRGLQPEPRLVVVTASGEVDVAQPAVQAGALFLTTPTGSARLTPTLPDTCEVWVAGAEKVELGMAVDRLQREGMPVVLTEGGPHVMGDLLRDDRLDELFVTVAPVLAGREGPGRLAMIEGTRLLPSRPEGARICSARRQDDFLYLRYRINRHFSGGRTTEENG